MHCSERFIVILPQPLNNQGLGSWLNTLAMCWNSCETTAHVFSHPDLYGCFPLHPLRLSINSFSNSDHSASKNCLIYFWIRRCWNIYTWTSKDPKQLFSPANQRYLTYVRNCEEYFFYPILNWCLFRWTAVEWKWEWNCDTWHSRVVQHFTCKKCLIDQAFQVTSYLLEKCQKGAICCDNIARSAVCNQTIAAKIWIFPGEFTSSFSF